MSERQKNLLVHDMLLTEPHGQVLAFKAELHALLEMSHLEEAIKGTLRERNS